MDTLEELWQAVLDYCKEHITSTAFNLWIRPIELSNFDGTMAYLYFDNNFKKKTVYEQFGKQIEEGFKEVCGFPVMITYVSPNDLMTANEVNKQNIEDLRNEKFTFENFIAGPSNKLAYTAAKAIAANPGGQINHDGANYNPLFIYGNSGLGKTHILNAIQYEIKRNFPDYKIVYVTCEQFLNEFISALSIKDTESFREKYRTVDVLLIDDIQFIAGKESTEEEFFHTFNTLVENGKQIVLTADKPPKEIQSLTDRMRSRFVAGLLADIQPPEFDTRCAIIKRKAEMMNFKIDDDIVQFIAEKVKSNIRQLEGTTKKLKALCEFSEQKASINLAQKAIGDILTEKQPLPVTIETILREVCRTTGVSVDDIRSKKRTSSVSNARKMVFYILREVTDMSFEDIGKEFGKDHSTVIYNIREMTEMMKENSTLSSQVNDIVNNIRDNQ